MAEGEPEKKEPKRIMPRTDLDFNLMTTDSVWGSPYISQEIVDRVAKQFLTEDEEGEPVVTSQNLWGLLNFYTRDMRLANLSAFNGEVKYCQYYLDLAGDFLQAEMPEPFVICLSRVATVLELSQSKGGFLRRRMNTFTSENFHNDMEPKKKSLFGGKPNQKGGG